MNIDIVEYSKKAHEAAKAKGWWDEVKPMETYLMLIISELAECMEADRKGKRATIGWNYTNNVPDLDLTLQTDRQYFQTEFEIDIKDSVEDELADTAIRIFDVLGYESQKDNRLLRKASRCFNHYSGSFIDQESTPAILFEIIGMLYEEKNDRVQLAFVLAEIACLAKKLNIDLLWHIDQKMKYNELRSYKHGNKAY